jgi:hypothetical protein
LFTGGKGNWVFSLTCLAAPHNGVSLLAILDVNPLITAAANVLGNLKADEILASAGISIGGMPLSEVIRAAKTEDTAYYDLSIAGAQQVNALTVLCPDSYYFSIPVDGTENGTPTDDMSLPLQISGAVIGRFTSAKDGVEDRWKPNDGLVNTISATYPFNQPYRAITDTTPFTADSLTPGSWHVFPAMRGDHGSVIGIGRALEDTLAFYREQMQRIDTLSRALTGGSA